ncbi:MAG: DUF4286 family protein [Chitinophagales bacterium]|nr:DUF4286 family protein [Chitinophagales bacterium]HAE13546.1 DUF4286 domain-containing protein [Bacteroidota bacterium]MCB9021356.1 DUF4286 family protein [Chitinophagales bacterium]MCB9031689.1 DUF4286 family protein [Chitinophagales bacterium]HAE35713.1 DUF4286 domain-containing protein [Bacteroidota bacterium]
MYIYNVTLKVDATVADDWTRWMRQTHIPEVIDTGYFTGYRMCRLLDDGDLDGITFVIQYECKDIDDFLAYQTTQAPGLQKAHAERYGETVIAFRTIMELLE